MSCQLFKIKTITSEEYKEKFGSKYPDVPFGLFVFKENKKWFAVSSLMRYHHHITSFKTKHSAKKWIKEELKEWYGKKC